MKTDLIRMIVWLQHVLQTVSDMTNQKIRLCSKIPEYLPNDFFFCHMMFLLIRKTNTYNMD